MPGIFPRLKDLFFSGFGTVTQLVGIICFMAGLLPKNHPCFSKEKRNEYGLIRILAASADNIELKWKNIDKILVFALIICATLMIGLYLLGLVFFLLSSPSFATSMFVTALPNDDIAFMMLDKVLGIPGLYNSSVSAVAPFPAPFHSGLHELFRFYSMGIFFIAFIIFFYHVVHFVLDVTQTGKVSEHLSDDGGDSGRGFSWLPIRFVVCFGLLIPFGMGLNSAQWITLYMAKWGSGLATNGWLEYNNQTGSNPVGEDNIRLTVKPAPLDTSGLIKNLFLIKSCQWMHTLGSFSPGSKQVLGYVVAGSNSKSLFNFTGIVGFMDYNGASQYNAKPQTIADAAPTDDFIKILTYSGFRDIRIIIGEFDPADPARYKEYPGGVLPVCGEVTIPVTGLTGEAVFASEGYLMAVMNILFDQNRITYPGSTIDLSQMQFAFIREYVRTSATFKRVKNSLGIPDATPILCGDENIIGACRDPVLPVYWNKMMDTYYKYSFMAPAYSAYDFLAGTDTAFTEIDPQQIYVFDVSTSYLALGKPNPFDMTAGILKYGWGGAGLWYNKIAERNGSLYSAATNVPIVKKFPLVMETMKETREKTDKNTSTGKFCAPFRPQKSGTSSAINTSEKEQFDGEQAVALYGLCQQLFENEAITQDGVTRKAVATNPLEKIISMFFSEFQLFNSAGNREVTPMAQLSSIGRTLLDKSILGVAVGAGSYTAAAAAHVTTGDNTKLDAGAVSATALGDFTMTFAMLGLASGFVLFYMLPLLPFIYFFFAVGRWVKVIFEALVGVPLWALAHMRVGGPGLPGSAAIGGYFLLLEIFMRPILTVFSLVAAYTLFSALTVGLNSTFLLISANLFGSVAPTAVGMGAVAIEMTRGIVDQFFLSIFYIALVYVIGTGCFKLIDLIPDGIMRWSGAGVQSWGASDISDDLVEQWQWELPVRFNKATSEIRGAFRDSILAPQERLANQLVNTNKKAALEKKQAAEAAAARSSNNGGGDQP